MPLRALLITLMLAACAPQGTGIGVNLVPDAEVQQAGLQAWADIKARVPASGDAGMQARATEVAGRVLRSAGDNPAEWEVVVFASDQVNAFALPGNKIGVYEGMMRLADTNDELATVVAHEVGHNKARHAAQRMNTETATSLGVNLLGAVLGGTNGQMVAALLGAGAEYGVILPYSRNQELEADQMGLHGMARAGYDPHAAITLWRKMAQKGGSRPPAFLSTHPDPENRIEQLQAEMPTAEKEFREARG
jgi:predicted Zn-dependent protease